MESSSIINIIKPKFYKKYIMGLSFIIVLNLIQIFGPLVMSNDLNLVVVVSQLVAIALMVLIFVNYFYKTINIDEGKITYKGLTFTNVLGCKDIKKVVFESKAVGKRPVYNLVFQGASMLTIKNAQNYNKEDLAKILLYVQSHSKVTAETIESVLVQI